MKTIFFQILLLFSINHLYSQVAVEIDIGDTGYYLTLTEEDYPPYSPYNWEFKCGSESYLLLIIRYREDFTDSYYTLVTDSKYFDLNNAYMLVLHSGGDRSSNEAIIYFTTYSFSFFSELQKISTYETSILNKKVISNIYNNGEQYPKLIAETIIKEKNNYIHIIVDSHGYNTNIENIIKKIGIFSSLKKR